MNTPIIDFLKSYDGMTRLHMPGHKGVENPFDLTEVEGADVLYNPHGIIEESERNASEIFGSGATAYSVEGSSLGIRASVYLVASYAKSIGKTPTILATRNVHSAFVSACALTGVNPEWICGNDFLSAEVSPESLDEKLSKTHAAAFYLTSPDYLGNRTDMRNFAEICHRHGTLFIVDNAHGAYLKFFNLHPLDFGADISIDSAHKTLPCLTGTAYLHIGKSAPDFIKDNLNSALSVFASSSPSYLLLSSLDKFNGLADDFKSELIKFADEVQNLKNVLTAKGYFLIGNEPMKITVATKCYGYYANEIADYLKTKNIVVEFADKDYLTMMFSPSNTASDLKNLEVALCALPPKTPINECLPKPSIAEKVLSIRNAVFSPSVEISTEKAYGKILAGLTLSCPPAVPIAISGERLDDNAVNALTYYGITKIKVVKE